jgi:hypothetical protein
MKFYVRRFDGNTYGPITASQLAELAKSGALTPDCHVQRENGGGSWHQASRIKGLVFASAPRIQAPPAKLQPQSVATAAAASRPPASALPVPPAVASPPPVSGGKGMTLVLSIAASLLSVVTGLAGYWLGATRSAADSRPLATQTSPTPSSPQELPESSQGSVAEDVAKVEPESTTVAGASTRPPQRGEPTKAADIDSHKSEAASGARIPPVRLPVLLTSPEDGRPTISKSLTGSFERRLTGTVSGDARKKLTQMVAWLRVSDREPASVQRAGIESFLSQIKPPPSPSDGTSVPDSPLTDLVARVESHLAQLDTWIKASDRPSEKLTLQAGPEVAAADGLAGLKWGPIPGWSPGVTEIVMPNGSVFSRVSCLSYGDPSVIHASLKALLMPARHAPPIARIPSETLAVFDRTVPGSASACGVYERMFVVNGNLVAVLGDLLPAEGPDLPERNRIALEAAKELADRNAKSGGSAASLALQKGVTTSAEYFVRWSSESGELFAAPVIPWPDLVSESLMDALLESLPVAGGYQVIPASVFSLQWTDQIKAAMALMSERTVSRIPVTGKDRLVIVCIGMKTPEGMPLLPNMEGPEVYLRGAHGRRFKGLGTEMSQLCMLTLTDAFSAGDPEVPSPADPSAYRAFLVPSDASGIRMMVAGSDVEVPIPVPLQDSGIDRQLIRLWAEMPLAEVAAPDSSEVSLAYVTRLAFSKDLEKMISDLAGRNP